MSVSPYPITLKKDNTFVFTSRSGHHYTVYFDRSRDMFNDPRLDNHAVYFGFSCQPSMKVFGRIHDPRIGTTIMYLIENFFTAYPDCILAYVCSSLDQQDRHRQILFARWYKTSPLRDGFIFMHKKIHTTYCGVIYNADHPQLFAIGDAFFDPDLESKPEVWEEEVPYFFDEEE